jgi:hypothetical protein
MVNEVITLPLRIGADATRLGVRAVGRAVTFGLSATGRLIEFAMPRPAPPPPSGDETPPIPSHRVTTPRPPAPAAPEPPPAHVSREAHVVESSADPGAEDGAGAAVRIQEPWNGYGRMTANDVIARLVVASAEELAAVALYERAHRDRRTVVSAAQRQLRSR